MTKEAQTLFHPRWRAVFRQSRHIRGGTGGTWLQADERSEGMQQQRPYGFGREAFFWMRFITLQTLFDEKGTTIQDEVIALPMNSPSMGFPCPRLWVSQRKKHGKCIMRRCNRNSRRLPKEARRMQHEARIALPWNRICQVRL